MSSQGFFSQIKTEIESNIEARLTLLQLDSVGKVSRLFGNFAFTLIVGSIFFSIMLTVSLMGGFFFATYTGGLFSGFAIVAGINLLILLFLILIRKKIASFITNKMIEFIFDGKEEKESPKI